MERQIYASSNEGDIIWEPFGGLASASVAAMQMKRIPFVAENNPIFQQYAENRLKGACPMDNCNEAIQ